MGFGLFLDFSHINVFPKGFCILKNNSLSSPSEGERVKTLYTCYRLNILRHVVTLILCLVLLSSLRIYIFSFPLKYFLAFNLV